MVVGDGGGPSLASQSLILYTRTDPHESVNPPEGGKVGAFKAGVLKGDFAQWWLSVGTL